MASKLKLKPLGGRVIVEPIEQEEMTAGGIILPETAKEKPQEAEVIALGTGKKDENGKVQPFETRRETIKVAGGKDKKITVRATGHGPLLSDAGRRTLVRRPSQHRPLPRG